MGEYANGIAGGTIPENPEQYGGKRLRERFNVQAEKLHLPLKWVKYAKNPLAVDAVELEITTRTAFRKYGAKGKVPTQFNAQLAADVRRVLKGMEADRFKIFTESAGGHQRITYRPPVELLNPVELAAVALLRDKVKPIINRIVARTTDRNADALREYMDAQGSKQEKTIFSRHLTDTCVGLQRSDPNCSLFWFYPDKPVINGIIDPSISLEDMQNLGKTLPQCAEELRPSTALYRTEDGLIRSVPLAKHTMFIKDHRELATALLEVANLTVNGQRLDALTRAELQAWATFFITGSAKDEFVAMQATIDAGTSKGRLRIHLGPSEGYYAANTKFPYALWVAIKPDPALTKKLDAARNTFYKMEKSLKVLPSYTPRTLVDRGGFSDPGYTVVIGGFLEAYYGSQPVGWNIPNYDCYRTEYGLAGGSRFIAPDTIQAFAADQAKTALSRIVTSDMSQWDAFTNCAQFVTGHESGHMIGPQRSHRTPSGKLMGAVFGSYWGRAEEAKADLTAIENVRMRLESGHMREAEANNILWAYVGWNLSNRYKGKMKFNNAKRPLPLHRYGHMYEVGNLFRMGAFKLVQVERNGKQVPRIEVNQSAVRARGRDLWWNIMTKQAAGDRDGFIADAKAAVSHIPDAADQLILKANADRKPVFMEHRF